MTTVTMPPSYNQLVHRAEPPNEVANRHGAERAGRKVVSDDYELLKLAVENLDLREYALGSHED